MGDFKFIWAALAWFFWVSCSLAQALPRERIEDFIAPPMSLGEQLNDQGLWQLLNSGGAEAGYVFETAVMAPLPGFSGGPINMLVVLDLNGTFLDVKLISHNEPIFVSGLGEAPFREFLEQYRGHSISDSMVVGTPYGGATDGGALVYLDGVTKATASVRIAHESILGAALQVAREKMQGISSGPPAYPNPDYTEDLDWNDLIDQGLVGHITYSNAQVQELFAGTLWKTDDPIALEEPDAPYLDLWLIDLGPTSIARAVLDQGTFDELQHFMSISTTDEPVLVIDTARHGLVSEDFVRNTAPDWISVHQDGLPIAMRDADIYVGLNDALPEALHDGAAMILRTDRRLGFDPTRDWTMTLQAVRQHGMFQPETGSLGLDITYHADERFYARAGQVARLSPFEEAIRNRQTDLIILAAGLLILIPTLLFAQSRLAGTRMFTPIRLTVLAAVIGFVGWWGQGQLSIVTPLAALQTALAQGSFAFLLYDPFGLAVWGAAILGFVLWGRGLFCGWLCPFGAMQEFAHHLGRLLRLPQITVNARWDQRLKALKYIALAGLVAVTVLSPQHMDKAVEIEPFKTAITTFFVREWYYVAYAALWLVLGLFVFKGFCRYLCPLGALMAIGGALRLRRWIPRRVECGTPCQLCRVKCNYGAIKKTGEIQYSECFQCLDCVTIHDSPTQCVPLILAAKSAKRRPTVEPAE
ncbi:4Fe-4S binding protein [Donghicola mangrovi]|uniref:4Fe-4S binding protein n=1 Tax=Donghicola mangrovi TaxID=2729614 RepID=A0A850Q3W1_9RHOB|nr:4Fe-4S binding protein [Donghicola mangrovi]NVO22712.1 4Fe-4S binding protein [Donghicola mangrovi]